MYIVQIIMQDKSKRYLSWKMGYTKPTLVSRKDSATRVSCRAAAEVLSDQVWSLHWDRDRFDTRAVIYYVARGKR